MRQERRGQHYRSDGEPDDRRRAPLVLAATPHRDQQQTRDGGNEQRRTEEIDRMLASGERQPQHRTRHHKTAAIPIGMLM